MLQNFAGVKPQLELIAMPINLAWNFGELCHCIVCDKSKIDLDFPMKHNFSLKTGLFKIRVETMEIMAIKAIKRMFVEQSQKIIATSKIPRYFFHNYYYTLDFVIDQSKISPLTRFPASIASHSDEQKL